MKKISQRILAGIVALTMSAQSGLAQGAVMPTDGILLASDTLSLPMIRGLQFDPSEPLNFNFVVDLADRNAITEDEALKLVRYFMAVLAVPGKDVWVNLSPDGKDRIIAPNFGATEAGEDLLNQDLVLKKLSSSFLHPDQELGKKFWSAAYQKIYEVYGLTDIPQDAFSRIWIVPQKAVIDEYKNAAYISESHLKVLMADEYESLKGTDSHEASLEADDAHARIAQIMKEVIVPEIEKQVNEGEHFAVLRQVYQSMILAVWFKSKLKDHLVNRVYADSSKTQGIDLANKADETKTFDSYLNIFRNGLYDVIRDDYDPVTQEMVTRKYVSGGFGQGDPKEWMDARPGKYSPAMLSRSTKNILLSVSLFLMTASSVFGQGILNRGDPITPANRGDIEMLQKFVTLNDVVGLNGTTSTKTGHKYNFNTDSIKAHWQDMFTKSAVDWELEAVIVTAQEKLHAEYGTQADGDFGAETRSDLQTALASQDTPNPSSSGGAAVDSTQQLPSGGSFNGGVHSGFDKQFQMQADFKASFADTFDLDFRSKTFVPQPPLLLHPFLQNGMGSVFASDSLKRAEETRKFIAQYFSQHARDTVAPVPPPDTTKTTQTPRVRVRPFAPGSLFSATSWSDVGTWKDKDGRWGGLYDTKNITFDPKGPLTFWTTTESTGLGIKHHYPVYTVDQYLGGSYNANNNVLLNLEQRYRLTRDSAHPRLTMLSFKYTPDSLNYSIAGMFSLASSQVPSEDVPGTMVPSTDKAFTLTATARLLGIDLKFGYLYGLNMNDWYFYGTHNFSSTFGLSFEHNYAAGAARYTAIPNTGDRLNFNVTVRNSTFGPYVAVPKGQIGRPSYWAYGLGFNQTFNPSAPGNFSVSKPSMTWFSYSDFARGAKARWAHYGQDNVNISQNGVGLNFLHERSAAYNSENNNYVPASVLYADVSFPLGKVFKTFYVGHRYGLVNNTTKVNYVGTTVANGDFTGDVRYGYSMVDNSDGSTSSLKGLSVTATQGFFHNTVSVTGMGYVFQTNTTTYADIGGSVTYQLPKKFFPKGYQKYLNGTKLGFAYNPTSALIPGLFTTPDQHIRGSIMLPQIKAGSVLLDLTAYWAIAKVANQSGGFDKENQPGLTVKVSPGTPKYRANLKNKLKPRQSLPTEKVGMNLPPLPEGVAPDSLKMNGLLTDFDKKVMGIIIDSLGVGDFTEVYGNAEGRRKFKAFKKQRKAFHANPGYFKYNQDLFYGMRVAEILYDPFGAVATDATNRRRLLAINTLLGGTTPEGGTTTIGAATDKPVPGVTVAGKDKAMMFTSPEQVIQQGLDRNNGGVDLSATEAATETRVHGAFEGLKDMDPAMLINPETFRGFGVKLIGMRPIFDLSKVFTPDNSPVMLSQL